MSRRYRGFRAELRARVKFFLGLLVVGCGLMKLIIYLTRVLAYYFMYGAWKFF
jgi:hypothetical protein